MRILIGTGLGLLLALWPLAKRFPGDEAAGGTETEHDPERICATGCAVGSGELEGPTRAELETLLDGLRDSPLDADNLALATLLFHGARVGRMLDGLDGLDGLCDRLDPPTEAFLRRELERRHARLDVRFLNADGSERLRLGARRIPLDEKQHLFPSHAEALTPPEISGTVRRVGLDHLWVRL